MRPFRFMERPGVGLALALPLALALAPALAMTLGWMLGGAVPAQAQGRGGPPQPPRSAKASAPIDITGYWVSLVTEDWRYRMATPPKGDFTSIPLNQEGEKVAKAWDPAKDEAAGEQCKAYSAPAIMRVPGRLHITWEDEETLKLETDAGTQTRMFRFKPAQRQGGDWQGVSAASWDRPGSPMAIGFFGGSFVSGLGNIGGSLKVVTTGIRPGYLRKNGIPFSANAVLTEYFDRFDLPGGDSLLLDIAELNDPAYLASPFWTSTHFKKLNGPTGWNPTPCSAR